MTFVDLLVPSPWLTWLGAVLLLVVSALLTLAVERSRRKTYESLLLSAPAGTFLMDSTRRGRVLLVVRVPDRRPARCELINLEGQLGGR